MAWHKNIASWIWISLAVLMILLVNAFRFYDLKDTPRGFYVDEMSGGVTLACMAAEGVDAHLVRYPLFADLHYGTPKPPTYLYPGMWWVKAFGFSQDSLRALTAFGFVVGLAGIFMLARIFIGTGGACWVLLAGTISPWSWMFSRIAFESLWLVTFLSWGMWALFSARRWWGYAAAGALLSLTMYTYPLARAGIPLLLPLLFWMRCRVGWSGWQCVAAFMAALILVSVPLVQYSFKGALQQRFNEVSITSPEYLKEQGKKGTPSDLAGILVRNYASHFTPQYLFIKGDPEIKHSTHQAGEWSWLDMLGVALAVIIAIIGVVRRKEECCPTIVGGAAFVTFCIVGYLIGIVPSALTTTTPHALRSIGAWPFLMLLAGYGMHQAVRRWHTAFAFAGLMVAGVFVWMFLTFYFKEYPRLSTGMFSPWTRAMAEAALAPGAADMEWVKFRYTFRRQDYDYRYYAMLLKKDGCRQSKKDWDEFGALMQKMGKY